MGTPSEKQIEANRLNALRSTGPRTAEGKAISRRNGMIHGLAAEVLVSDDDRIAYDMAMARWEREAGPDNVVETHLIRRAAAGSVRADRIERAREATRRQSARDAVDLWERRRQARARKKGQLLPLDPANVLPELESSAFGCDWLIRRWRSHEASLRVGKPLDQLAVCRIQNLLGLPDGLPCDGADPVLRGLWILASSWSPSKVNALPRLTEAERRLPAEPEAAREALLAFFADRVDRLERLRDESWELVEGPERDAVAQLAAAADTSKGGQLSHRYEVAADRATNAAIRLFLNLRDRRRKEHIELAREAKDCHLLRAPVGGGWWREPDADPAPPGFERIGPTPVPTTTPTPGPTAAEPSGAPARSEPISTEAGAAGIAPKSFSSLLKRHDLGHRPADPDWRTGSIPTPAEPPRIGDHPPANPPSRGDSPPPGRPEAG
jgi:hypothetical protein